MKTQAIILLAMSCLISCRSHPRDTRALDAKHEPAAGHAGGDSVLEDDTSKASVLTGLGERLLIRTEADSWQQLLDKVRPTFAWNGCDLMWIGKDERGRPQFTLDEAFRYEPTNGPPRWVLPGTLDGHCLRSLARFQATVPVSHNDAGRVEDYAVAISTHPNFGTVYEIGWQQPMANGTSLAETLRRLFVLQDAVAQWHYLGEGIPTAHGKCGGNTGDSYTATPRVVWSPAESNGPAVQIHFLMEGRHYQWAGDGDESFEPRPDFVTFEEYVLAGPFPAALRRTTKHPYLVTKAGDTFDSIVELVSSWLPDWDLNAEKRKLVIQMWRTELVRLNPGLPKGRIKEASRVQLLDYGKVVQRLKVRGFWSKP